MAWAEKYIPVMTNSKENRIIVYQDGFNTPSLIERYLALTMFLNWKINYSSSCYLKKMFISFCCKLKVKNILESVKNIFVDSELLKYSKTYTF
jgi:hypothetical protein